MGGKKSSTRPSTQSDTLAESALNAKCQTVVHQPVDSQLHDNPFFYHYPDLVYDNEVQTYYMPDNPERLHQKINQRCYSPSPAQSTRPPALSTSKTITIQTQVLNLLNEKEVKLVLPTCAIVPRTFVLKPGMALFLAALGRIDYLQVPMGGEERMKDFPPLRSQDVMLEGIGEAEAMADIKLSSAGWVAVTAHSNNKIHLRCYTPKGTALTVRKPPLLPYIIDIKGPRVKGSPAYKTIRPPTLVKNLKANINQKKKSSKSKM
ncbi:hypothetical protein JD844_009819 [Phrynosoma platyrhinos]|uniref:Uncharacterized protein n=1 Tax=Phrynosoma platyrhinos TaxID=52577 RepID=A0ABQ7TFV7_PHRPL|nr:hypothetical protein JD844_009819 [Phrynosoma platyrhinos]